MNEFETRRGETFTRLAIAKCVHAWDAEGADFAKARWGHDTPVARILKTGVSGLGTADFGELEDAAVNFLDVVRSASIISKLPLRVVPPLTPVCLVDGGAQAHWPGEGKAVKASAMSFDRSGLPLLKVGAIVILANDALESPAAEPVIQRDLIQGCAAAIDAQFIGAAGATPGESPASILYNAPTVTATGDLSVDLAALLAAFTGSLQTAAFITSPGLAAQLALGHARGVGADIGLRGGTLLGLPLIVSEAMPRDSDGHWLALIDAGRIAYADALPSVQRSNVATVELDGAPTGDGLTPDAATATLVSMFHTESTALLCTIRCNWITNGAAVVLTGASYPAVAS